MRVMISLWLLAIFFLTDVSLGYAQIANKMPRIGFIATGYPVSIAHLLEGFKQGLREHGYVEGKNVVLELRYGEAKAKQIPILAADLVRLNVDVIIAIPNPAIDASPAGEADDSHRHADRL